MDIYRSTRNSIFAENELKGFNLRANSAKTLLTNVLDMEEDFAIPPHLSEQSQTNAMKSLLKSALDMQEDYQLPQDSNPHESTLTKSLLRSALDMEGDFQPPKNLDLDYDFRMCNIVNPETDRIKRSVPKTASLLRSYIAIDYQHSKMQQNNLTMVSLNALRDTLVSVLQCVPSG